MADHGDEHNIIVVGAGIAGLALLRELTRREIAAIALERYSTVTDAGLAINLPGNAIAALRELGVGNVRRYGVPVNKREYRASNGRLLFKVDEASFWGTEDTPQCMRRSELALLLREGVPEPSVLRQRTVTSAIASGTSVAVTTTKGEKLTGRYLVGADGIRSTVRELCFPGAETSVARLAQSSYRFVVSNPGVDCWTVWMGERAIILLIPMGLNDVYGWATVTNHVGPSSNPGELLRHMKDFPSEPRKAVEEALANPAGLFSSPLTEVRLSSWNRGRAVLIGDAGHATAPVWAQGAALALEDGLALAELLATGEGFTGVGEEFTRLRRDRIRHVQTMTDRASNVSRLPLSLRKILMRYMGPLSYRNTYEPLKANRGSG